MVKNSAVRIVAKLNLLSGRRRGSGFQHFWFKDFSQTLVLGDKVKGQLKIWNNPHIRLETSSSPVLSLPQRAVPNDQGFLIWDFFILDWGEFLWTRIICFQRSLIKPNLKDWEFLWQSWTAIWQMLNDQYLSLIWFWVEEMDWISNDRLAKTPIFM